MPELRGEFLARSTATGGVKIGEKWYATEEKIRTYTQSLKKGDKVKATYEIGKKGGAIINAIFLDKNETTATATEPAEFKCIVCGKELKDGKYKKCYECNKSGAVAPSSAPEEPTIPTTQGQSGYSGGSKYGSAEDVAGKEVGCAANCASTMLSNRTEMPEQLAEMFKILVREVLNTIRELK